MPFNQFFYSKVPTENHRGQGRVSDICTNLTYPDILPEAYVQAVSSTKTVEKNENLLHETFPFPREPPRVEENAAVAICFVSDRALRHFNRGSSKMRLRNNFAVLDTIQ